MKITKDKTKIFNAILILVLLMILLITIVDIVKTIQKKSIPTISMTEESSISAKIEEQIDESNNIEENNIEKSEQNKTTSAKENNSKISKSNNTNTYYIKVNYGANVVTVYTKDNEGNYTVPVKAMVCSTGRGTPRSGTYPIKGRWEWGTLFGGVYGHYVTHIVGNILFHSVPYLKKGDPSSLEYWEYDKLGTSASMGCIRLKISDAQWIYNNIPRGTLVEFYSSADPGPLGKPSAQRISGNVECRGWDPTDPNSLNPWHNYFKLNNESIQDEVDNNANNSNDNKNETNTTVEDTSINDNNNVNDNVVNETDDNVVDDTDDNNVNEVEDNEIGNNIIEENINNTEENITVNNILKNE